MKKLIEFGLSLLFVHKCFLCGRVIGSGSYLCQGCCLPTVGLGELCPRCGKPLADCVCRRLPESRYDFAAAPLYYTFEVAHGIHKLKYSGRSYYADFLAPLMYAQLLQSWPEVTFDLVTWVPMHPKKQRKRGFCQSELLARRLAQALGLPLRGDLLRNTGKGRTQMEQKGWKARRENAAASYRRNPEARIEGLTVLLVDDVLTTGWTGASCGGLLHQAGAGQVYLLTAATTKQRSVAKGAPTQ